MGAPISSPDADVPPASAANDLPVRNQRAGIAFIFVTILIDILGFSVIIPVLPKLVAELVGGNASDGAFYFGLLLSCYGLMQFFFLPVLSDHFGRRPVLLISMCCTGIEYLIMATAHNVWILFAGRVLTGITGASITVATAYIADVSPPELRAKNFGVIGAAFGIGFILGPAAGGLLGAWSLRAPFWASAVLSLLNVAYGSIVLPESLAVENRRPFALKAVSPGGGIRLLTRHRWIALLGLSIVLTSLAFQSLPATWVLYTTYRFHWNELDNGLSLALVGLVSGVVQGTLTGPLVRRLGEPRTIYLGLAFNCLGFMVYATASRSWMMAAGIIVGGLSNVAGPSTQSLISKQYGPDEQGLLQGSVTSVQSLMGIAGPLLATGVFSYFTSRAAPFLLPGAPFYVSGVLAAAAAVAAWVALGFRDRKETPQ